MKARMSSNLIRNPALHLLICYTLCVRLARAFILQLPLRDFSVFYSYRWPRSPLPRGMRPPPPPPTSSSSSLLSLSLPPSSRCSRNFPPHPAPFSGAARSARPSRCACKRSSCTSPSHQLPPCDL